MGKQKGKWKGKRKMQRPALPAAGSNGPPRSERVFHRHCIMDPKIGQESGEVTLKHGNASELELNSDLVYGHRNEVAYPADWASRLTIDIGGIHEKVYCIQLFLVQRQRSRIP